MKKWLVKSIDKQISDRLMLETKLPAVICDLLVSRGIQTAEKAQEYFNGDTVSDPMLMKDMDKAVETIEEAIQNEEKITVYGDYDCDGITATVMLYSYLDALGAEVDWYIPTRDEGYGLNEGSIKKLCDNGTDLIITVDNGISAVKEAELIYELGMKLVVTDHHQPPEELPKAEAIVDPHRADDSSPYKHLAGCAVALKLIMAMEQDTEGVLEQYSDIAAIGTVGDVVPLTGENRIIVRRGLSEMQYSENEGLLSLISASGLDEENMTSTGIAFGLCPRINAAGRYGSPDVATKLLLAQNRKTADMLANQLCELNTARKETENEILEKAIAGIKENPRLLDRRVLIVSGEGWNHGIIGIVSARLLELYEKPCIVIGIEGNEARGSARSIEGFSIYSALESCSDLLTKFGGHVKAAGFSLPVEFIDEFKRRMYDYAAQKFPTMPAMIIEADMEPDVSQLSISEVENLKYMQPFGEQNTAPLFLMKNCEITSSRPLKEGKYTSFTAQYKGGQFKFLCFGIPYEKFFYHIGDRVDVLANAEVNEYNDTKSVSLRVKDIRLSSFEQDKYFAAKNFYEKILRGEKVDKKLFDRIAPTPQNMRIPFDIIKTVTDLDSAVQLALSKGINYCLFMMCLHIFAESGYLELDRVNRKMHFIKGNKKIEPEQSAVMKRIIKSCQD
ncbi:MAG: single-stranded-DNA-specific exonuclease RecJ [Ruminiclostridium sp.]|nr:single-stranded-DNA-specific exonuclease RecJ [Ruminiclostridium sp.]